MSNEDIKIVIKKGDTQEGTSPSQEQVASAKPNKKEEGKPDTTQGAVNAAIIQVGKQMLMTGFQKFGDLSGNYAAVRNVNAVMSVAADVMTIAAAGPVGAVYVAGKYANQLMTAGIDHMRNVQEHEFNVQRLGTISTKGSRY